MPFLKRISIRTTLIGSSLLVVLALLLLSCWGWLAVGDMQGALRSLRENELELARIITAANAALRGWALPAADHIVEDRPDQMARYEQGMKVQREVALEQLQSLSRLERFPALGGVVLDRIRRTLDEAAQTHADVVELSAAGHKSEAALVFREQLKPTLDRLEGYMGEFRNLRQTQLDSAVAAAQRRLAAAAARMAWLTGGTAACVGLLLSLTVRRISRGVAEVVRAAAVVTRDVLHQELAVVRTTNEVDYLKDTLAALRLALEASLAERSAVQEHLRTMEADLAHAARVSLMGEMASGLGHELTQPLAAIAAYTQACLERIEAGPCPPEDLRPTLQSAATQTQRAGAIIRCMRGFVRKQAEPRVPLEIEGVVREALTLLDHETRRRRARIELSLTSTPLRVWANRIELEQVIVNLVRNALDAMSATPDPVLTIRTRRGADESIEVAIVDRGVGLAPEILENLFKPFFTTKPNGIGLGLATSRTIVEAHGGRLSATANPDGGAVFSFTLPAYRGSHVAVA